MSSNVGRSEDSTAQLSGIVVPGIPKLGQQVLPRRTHKLVIANARIPLTMLRRKLSCKQKDAQDVEILRKAFMKSNTLISNFGEQVTLLVKNKEE